ncbi:MAG TPA: hypothetical protein DIW23_10355 [Anaerolineae bacterium]|nr:hypothetical protein [Anaerolineae bacterium]HRJ75320.1 hypothetical protein [Anaerolineales bacterium]
MPVSKQRSKLISALSFQPSSPNLIRIDRKSESQVTSARIHILEPTDAGELGETLSILGVPSALTDSG